MEWWQLSLSLPLGFNFLLSCLKAITVASCQNRHGTRCSSCACIPHGGHITVSEMVRDFPSGFSPVISYNIWRCGAASKLRWRSALLHSATHLWEGPSARWRQTALAGLRLSGPPCLSCFNICLQLGRMQISISTGGGLFFCVAVCGEEWLNSCLKTIMH